ncbi:MAG: non-ribosomal peptide synthetase [Clostridium sp.]|uniref:non-ribosomal peptide synthetase n=1 Tax=Clostridium sp. TaxID=1506 RepID=UPI0025BD5C5D|nr:AMP-binding protein [Clostridium sp.]MCE5219814.1 non-ribosomal peptide synthetase [Clostridium sp.]
MDSVNKKLLKLKEELTLKKIFSIICENSKKIAAIYTEHDENKEITYEKYEQLTKVASSKLLKVIGKQNKGSYIGIKLDNCYEWPILFWAILMSGFKPLLLDFRIDEKMTLYLMNEAGAVGLISNEDKNKYKNIVQIKPNELINDESFSLIQFHEDWANEIALCTSGTTSTAKIYVYNGYAVSKQLLDIEEISKTNSLIINDGEMRVLAFLPFSHIFGLLSVYLIYSFSGKIIIYLKNRGKNAIGETCRNLKVTHVFAVPLLWNNLAKGILNEVNKSKKKNLFFKLLKYSLYIQSKFPTIENKYIKFLFKNIHKKLLGNDLQLLICGGGYVLPETLKLLNGIGLNVVCGFGMTEVGITSVNLENIMDKKLFNCLGKPFESIKYKIVSLKNISNDNTGELYIKGESIHSGRLEKGNLLPPLIDDEGWFATGDIGSIQNGDLILNGRIKDVIVNESGENVYPDELEAHFDRLNYVHHLCIVGTISTNKYENITLILDIGNNYNNNNIINELSQNVYEINGNLPVYKKLQKVLISTEPLDKFVGLKAQRQKLKQFIEENELKFIKLDLKQLDKASEKTTTEQVQQNIKLSASLEFYNIKNILRQHLADTLGISIEEIKDDSDFIEDLGGDSIETIELLTNVEENFNVMIPASEYYKCTTINNLSALLMKLQNGSLHYK